MRLIDADALIAKHGKWYTEEGTEEGFIGTLKSLIDAQPTIEAEPVKHGHWIAYQNGRWIYAKCSECESVQDVQSNYCPSCGARMNGGNA